MPAIPTTADTNSSKHVNDVPASQNNADAPYALPNDDPEQVRLETQARHLSAITNNQLVRSPLPPLSDQNLRILDVGGDAGSVTDHLASRFPSAQVYRLDQNPVTPPQPSRSRNVSFLQGGILTDPPSTWSTDFPPTSDAAAGLFDLIFSRTRIGGMDRGPEYFDTALRLLRPGCFLEVHDVDWVWYDGQGPGLRPEWGWWGERLGREWESGSRAVPWMREAGFEDIRVEVYRWPWMGGWESEEAYRGMGEDVRGDRVALVWNMIETLVKQVDMRGEGSEERLMGVLREEMWKDVATKQGRHLLFYVTVGRKPSS